MTMIIANVLPDRSAGFVATDTRVMDGISRQGWADCGGKIVKTPFGWGCVTSNHGPRCREVLLALRDTPAAPDDHPVSRLEGVVRAAFDRAECPIASGSHDGTKTLTAVLEQTSAGIMLAIFQELACTEAGLFVAAHAGGDEEKAAHRGSSIREQLHRARWDLAERIQLAAQCFVLAAADSPSVSSELDIGFLLAAPDGQRLHGFLHGPAAAIAISPPHTLMHRFLAATPRRIPSELFADQIRDGREPYTSTLAHDVTGAVTLVDTLMQQVGIGLVVGTGARTASDATPVKDVIQRLRSADGNAVATFGAVDGSQVKFLSRGYQKGTARHGDTVTFSPAFAQTPTIRLKAGLGAVLYEPRAGVWTFGTGTFDATQPQRQNLYAGMQSAAGFVMNAQLRQQGGTTANVANFPPGNNLTAAAQATFSGALAAAPSSSNHYIVRYKGSVTASSIPAKSRSITVVVVVNRRAGGSGGAITELSRLTYSATDPDGSGPYTTAIDEALDLVFVGMGVTDVIEVTIASITVTGTGSSSCSVKGVNPTDFPGLNGVTYYTGAADALASMTPDAGNYIEWEAWAVQ